MRACRSRGIDGVVLDVECVRARLPSGCVPAAVDAVLRFHARGRLLGPRGLPTQEAIARTAGWTPETGTSFEGLVRALATFLPHPPDRVPLDDRRAVRSRLERDRPIIVLVGTGAPVAGHAVVLSGLLDFSATAPLAVVCDPVLHSGYRLLVDYKTLGACALAGVA